MARLATQRDILQGAMKGMENEIQSFLGYLDGPKFRAEGEDYIRTWEVKNFLRCLQDIQTVAKDAIG